MEKILYIITLPEEGGAQKYVLDLARSLKDKYKILVASGGEANAPLFQKLKKEKIGSHLLKNLKREISLRQDILAVQEIRRLIKNFQPDIIHLNSSKAGAVGALASWGLKAKVVYTVHGFVFNEPLPLWKKKAYFWIEKISAHWKDKLIVLSEKEKQTALQITSPSQIEVIPNGLDIKSISFLSPEKARQKLKIPSHKIVIGSIANYYPTKALVRFVKAASIVKKEFPSTRFVLIGQGPEEEKIKKAIRENNLADDFWLGPLPQAYRYLKAFQVFVLPSQKEGFPYSILEAIAAKTPIVAARVGGIPEIITDGKNGFLVDSCSPEKEIIKNLAEKIVYLLNHPKTGADFAARTYEKLLQNFTLEKMVENTLRLYRSLKN